MTVAESSVRRVRLNWPRSSSLTSWQLHLNMAPATWPASWPSATWRTPAGTFSLPSWLEVSPATPNSPYLRHQNVWSSFYNRSIRFTDFIVDRQLISWFFFFYIQPFYNIKGRTALMSRFSVLWCQFYILKGIKYSGSVTACHFQSPADRRKICKRQNERESHVLLKYG